MGTIDAVYPLGTGSKAGDLELRFSLRALEKNFSDLGRVFVVGACPPWLTGVIHIQHPDSHRHNKDANIIDKVLAACRAGVSEQFVRSSDDEMILLPSTVDDIQPYHGRTLDLSVRGEGWKERLLRTGRWLHEHGFSHKHYDMHIPNLYDRDRFVDAMARAPYREGKGFTINTLYYNQLGIEGVLFGGQKLTLEGPIRNLRVLRDRIRGKRFLGFNDSGFNKVTKALLLEMLPEPSRFESDRGALFRGVKLRDTQTMPQVVAVIGVARSGTSCTAGIVHHLGVSMGEHLRPPNNRNQRGFYEDLPLRAICRMRDGNNVQRFRRYAIQRGGAIIGIKECRLCTMVPALVKAFPSLKVIAVDREPSEVLASMKKDRLFPAFRTDQRKMQFITNQPKLRDIDLRSYAVPTLRLKYKDVISNPEATVNAICAFLRINPPPEQRQEAIAFVDPSLKHHGGAA